MERLHILIDTMWLFAHAQIMVILLPPGNTQELEASFSLLLTETRLHVPDMIIILCFMKFSKTCYHAEELD